MKVLPALLLGLMLLTMLVGITYATPLQPAQNSGNVNACVGLKPNDPNYYGLGCAGASHQAGNEDPPHPNPHHCVDSKTGIDDRCCEDSITPHSPEVSDIQPSVDCQP